MRDVTLVSVDIWDIDIHPIPERGDEPEHLHYDIRFLFEVSMDARLTPQESESKELRWITIDEVESLVDSDPGIMRMVGKLVGSASS